MPQPEPSEIWVNVFEILGLAFTGGSFAWIRSYLKGRAEESDHRSDLPARAIGAAFVDRAASDALVGMADDVKAIRTLAERRSEAAAQKATLDQARRVARDEAERVNREHRHRGEEET